MSHKGKEDDEGERKDGFDGKGHQNAADEKEGGTKSRTQNHIQHGVNGVESLDILATRDGTVKASVWAAERERVLSKRS